MWIKNRTLYYFLLAVYVCGTPNVMGVLVKPLPMGNGREAFHNPKKFYFASTLDATQIAALPDNVVGKNRLGAEQTLFLNLLVSQVFRSFTNESHIWNWGTHVIRGCSMRWRNERNERTKLNIQSISVVVKKAANWESLEQFHAVLSGLAVRYSFGALESRVLRDVFIDSMTNREAQNELPKT